MRKKTKWLLSVILFFMICVAIIYAIQHFQQTRYETSSEEMVNSQPLMKTIPKEAAQKDLRILFDTIKSCHPAFIDGSMEAPTQIEKQYNLEISNLKTKNSVLDIWQAAGRITASFGDMHTKTGYISDTNATYDISEQEKATLISINSIPADTLYKAYISQTPFEQEAGKKEFFSRSLPSDSFLQFVGIDTKNGVEITIQNGQEQKSLKLSKATITRSKDKTNPVEYIIDKEHNLGIFTLNSCIYDSNYKKTLDSFFQEVSDNSISNIAIDLRENSGGSSEVINEFVRYLPVDKYHIYGKVKFRQGKNLSVWEGSTFKNEKASSQFHGNVFALTSTFTFSSGLDFAVAVSDNKIGRIIGATPANTPSSYGDVKLFQLPATGLVFQVSTKYFERFIEEKTKDPLVPDYEVPAEDALNKLYGLIQ